LLWQSISEGCGASFQRLRKIGRSSDVGSSINGLGDDPKVPKHLLMVELPDADSMAAVANPCKNPIIPEVSPCFVKAVAKEVVRDFQRLGNIGLSSDVGSSTSIIGIDGDSSGNDSSNDYDSDNNSVRGGGSSWSSLDSYDDPLTASTPPKRPRKALEHLHTTSHSGKLPFGRVGKRARTDINATTPGRALTTAQLAELDMLAVAVTRLLKVRARTPTTEADSLSLLAQAARYHCFYCPYLLLWSTGVQLA
jgi:hypothetical protein